MDATNQSRGGIIVKDSKEKFPSIDDITDSTLIMNSKPHKFVLFLIYIILSIVITFFIWAGFTHKDEYVKVSGQIRPSDENAIITSSLNGAITDIKVSNGDIVKKGQLLIKLDTSALQKEEKLVNDEIDDKNNELKNYELLKQSIRENTNEFDKNGESSDFYDMFEKYKNDLNNANEQVNNDNISLYQNKQNATETLQQNIDKTHDLQQEIANYTLYKSSVEDDKDEFPANQKNSSVYTTYKVYKNNYDNLKEKIQQNLDDSIDLQTQLQTLKLKEVATINNSIDSLNTSLKASQFAVDNSQKSLTLFNQISSGKSIAEQNITLTTLNQITDSIETLNQNILSYQLKLVDIKNSIDNSSIKANKNGKIMLQTTLKVGTNINAGNELMRIVSTNKNLTFELTVPNRDISSFQIGKEVKFEINSLPYIDYGKAKGIITDISPDAIIDEKTNLSYYLVDCSIDETQLKSKDGKIVNLLAGMQGQGIVIDKPRTVLSWILKELNMLLNN